MGAINLNTAFDLRDLFKQIHGYAPAVIPGLPDYTDNSPGARITPTTKKTTTLYGQPLYGQADMMGQQVFCPVTIEVAGVNYDFPFAVIGIERTKAVKITEMTELNSSFKQIIGNKDFEITIKGFVIGDYEQFPDEKLKVLNDVFEYNQIVRLKSAFSDIFLHSDDSVLITKLSIPEKPKVIGVRDFAMQMISDKFFSLIQN